VTFKWPNNFFEFEFAALSYAQSKQNQYAYFLEGFEEEWSYIGTRRFGRYTNIPGGTYTLRIKGSNNDDVWNQEGVGVRIAVVPPFWQTWWFRITIAVAAVGGPYAAFRLRLRVIETQRRQLATEVDARTRELRETLVQLERSKEAAEAANRAKSIFLANMSHELRTPLNAILGFTELMSHDPDLSTLQKENLAIINQSGEHLLSLINEVLELSKIEAGRMVLKERSFDLHHLLSGLEDMFRLRAEEKDLILFFDRHSDVPQYVWMDEGKLRQVLMNLLGNAVKFTETGSVTLRIASAAVDGSRAEGLRLAFEVEDTGPGIAPEELTAVFAPFEQTVAGQNSREGTGLGLPISRQYVRLMGGELTASSPLPSPSSAGGPGSLFRFDVPAALVDVSTIRRPRPARQVIGMEPDQPIYRLLIVEDNWANRRLLIQLLTPLGFELREAVNGQEALEIWDGWAPDLILMDMRMPVMDGYEATKRIKATAKGQNTIVIALTASALEEDRAAVLAEGCDGFVRKPFRQEELFDALAEHLGVRFVYQELPSVAPTRRRPPGDGLATASPREALAALPADLVTDLHGATLRADLDSIASVIDRIRTKDEALADSLADLAHSFDHDTILGLIQSLGEHHE
jgi:signal transduction histidine kinase/DNA-binding NarL/FixJ family response regulator